MNMIEPEIYLFGPSDLVPDHEFNFRPKPDFEISIGADHHSSVDEYFKIAQPGRYLWIDLDQYYNKQRFVNSVIETGSADFSIGNQQLNNSADQTEILYQINTNFEAKKYSEFPDSIVVSAKRQISDRENYFYHVSGQIRNNPLINSDLWNLKGEVIQNGNRNTIGIMTVNYSKSLSFLNWVSDGEVNFYQGGFIKGTTGLEFETDSWVFYGAVGYSYIKPYGSEKIYFENEPNAQIRLENNTENFHNRLNIEINGIYFKPESYFISSFWFLSDTNTVGSNSIFPEKYSVNYQMEWIPSPNWIFRIESDYSRKTVFKIENYFEQMRSLLNILKVRTSASYFFERNKLTAYHEFSRSFDGVNNIISTAYLPEHSVGFDMDFLADDESDRFLFGGNYQTKTKIFNDQVDFSESKYTDFSEIYFKIEDFHARPVKLFAEIKLYLSDDHYYPGLIFEKYNYRAGLSLKF